MAAWPVMTQRSRELGAIGCGQLATLDLSDPLAGHKRVGRKEMPATAEVRAFVRYITLA
jgi:hypothetical protein